MNIRKEKEVYLYPTTYSQPDLSCGKEKRRKRREKNRLKRKGND
jgi:hypothetical protein